MLRRVLYNFQRTLVIHGASTRLTLGPVHFTLQRSFFQNALANTATNPELITESANKADTPTESDLDYIVPYRTDYETYTKRNIFVETLEKRYQLSKHDIEQILKDEVVKRTFLTRSLLRALDQLSLEGVTRESFVEYPWLLTIEKMRMDQKLELIKTLKMKDINDFIPFLRVSTPRLRKLVKSLSAEARLLGFKNRLYYISDILDLDPKIVTKFLHKRLFILEMSFKQLDENLKCLVEYNVHPLSILKDLWAFRYTPSNVKLRLERARIGKKNKLMPWMVRCPEGILQRSLKITEDELNILNGKTSSIEYLAERLDVSIEEAKGIMDKHPLVHQVRVAKMKEILDYLLIEEGFARWEISLVPRILCHSLDTTRQRLEELKSIGCRPSSLIIVCRSKREYQKFITNWLSTQQRLSAIATSKDQQQQDNTTSAPL